MSTNSARLSISQVKSILYDPWAFTLPKKGEWQVRSKYWNLPEVGSEGNTGIKEEL